MKVTAETKVRDALAISDTMIDAFELLSPDFRRLRNRALRAAMGRRTTIAQAARVAKIPLSEALFVLNLEAGEDVEQLSSELRQLRPSAFDYYSEDAPIRPGELAGLADDDPRIRFVDVMPQAERFEDPRPAILRGALELRGPEAVLLMRHPFDPVPLRDLLARRGLSSWAEEREPHVWYIYFYHPGARAEAVAHPPINVAVYARAAAAAG
jgi:hypothetical protein